jgi:hypothetical protein
VDEKAKQVVATVSLIGTLLAGLGLIATGQLGAQDLVRWIAIAAVAAAMAAVILAVAALLLRIGRGVAPGNLIEVRHWYDQQFRRAYLVVAAGVLLLTALLLAAVAAISVILADRSGQPMLAMQVTGTGADATVKAIVQVDGAKTRQPLSVEVSGVGPKGRVILARAVGSTDATGKATVTIESAKLGSARSIELTAMTGDRTCRIVLAADLAVRTPPGAGTATCSPAVT